MTVASEVSSNNDIEVTTIDDDGDDAYISTDETKIVAKVVALDLKTLVQTNLCSNCNVSVSIENNLPGVIIVIMFQHKVHVNQKRIWD